MCTDEGFKTLEEYRDYWRSQIREHSDTAIIMLAAVHKCKTLEEAGPAITEAIRKVGEGR